MKKFMTTLDLNLNQILNAVTHRVDADPTTSVVEGQIIYNTSDKQFKYYNGTEWVACGSINDIVPVTLGGTGVDTLNAGEVLVGAGTDPVTTKAIDTTVTTDSENLVTSGAVAAYVNDVVTATDHLMFKGTIGADGAITSGDEDLNGKKITELTEFVMGWTFRASAEISVDVMNVDATPIQTGDIILCIADGSAYADTLFTVLQVNIDGAVTSTDTSATADTIPVYADTTGKVIKSSGKTIDMIASQAVVSARYTETNPELTPTDGVITWTVSHGLGDTYPVPAEWPCVQVFDAATKQSVVCDITITDINTVTVGMNGASTVAVGAYVVVVTV